MGAAQKVGERIPQSIFNEGLVGKYYGELAARKRGKRTISKGDTKRKTDECIRKSLS